VKALVSCPFRGGNKRMKKLICLFTLVILGFLIFAEAFAQNALLPKGYYVISSKKCTKDLTIQVLRDKRLGLNAQNASISIDALPALLRLIRENGKVCALIKLDSPIAYLEKKNIKPEKIVYYFLTEDHCAGSLEYIGTKTSMLSVSGNKIEWTKCHDVKTGKTIRIDIERYLKAKWEIKDEKTILFVQREAYSKKTHYYRFSYANHKWMRYLREDNEFWEDDDGSLPSINKFP
jgi:hypothetical protein